MTEKRKALGKGLGALIGDSGKGTDNGTGGVRKVNINIVEPNPEQPRKDMKNIEELAQSIKSHGIIQPIIVRKKGDKFEITAGERRWRAAQMAGLKKIPVIERIESDEDRLETTLIENIQRENLNPIEEAEAYRVLINRINLTQEELSKRVGKDRATIANSIRLLNLPDSIKEDVSRETISAGHARVLLSLENVDVQINLRDKIVKEGLSVRETESIAKNINIRNKSKKSKVKKVDRELLEVRENLVGFLGTKVEINGNKEKGTISIRYFSMEDLERISDLLLKN